MDMKIGKLEKVSLREIWRNEAKDFTSWLEDNLEILADSLDLSLRIIEREGRVGTFAVDLLAEDNEGNKAIVECQLEKTDHDHLGKVLTYLTNLEAKTAIWICSDPRPEHVKSITWLNEVTPADVSFYLVKVEGVRIGESSPAPLFSVICAPSEETKEIGKEREEFAERHRKRLEFWNQLLAKSKERTKLHANISPSKENWIGAGAGKSGLSYQYVIGKNWGGIELYIDKGKGAAEVNDQIYSTLHAKKDEIESEFGENLIWDQREGVRMRRIGLIYREVGLKDEDKWDNLQDKMIDAMVRLEKALKNHIRRLAI